MAVSRDEAKQLLINGLPPGIDQVWDMSGDIGRFLYALAGGLKQYGFDMAETVRLELNPATMTQKTPDWESTFGIGYSKTALFGNDAQRRNQVIGYLRSLGEGFSIPGLQSIFNMFLGYANPAEINIIETDRAALTVLNTVAENPGLVIGALAIVNRTFIKVDLPRVSQAGAQVMITFDGGDVDEISVRLTGPNGFSKLWPAGYITGTAALTDYYFYAPEFEGQTILGNWTLTITTGATGITYQQGSLFVEALGRNGPDWPGTNGLGAAMFDWLVQADPAKVYADVDYAGARLIVNPIKPAHTVGAVGLKNGDIPDSCTIPDSTEAIPDECISCS